MNHQAMARLCRPEGGYDVADKPVFYYGTAWYPEWEPEGEWRSDLDNMKRAGLNTVRIAEFSWEHLEPRPGEFHFELYDQVMARCEELGIWVVLGIDSVRPPVWLFEQYPDIHLVDQAGRPAPGSWPMHCFNHPGFLKTSARFIERVVNRYKGSPALVYYQLDNEPAYHARGSHRDRATCYCYCAHCQRAFRTWLSRRYPEQGMLRVPSPLPEPEVMGELLWLEWRRFHDETNVRRTAWVGQEVKRHDPDHAVTTNIMVGSQFGAGASRAAHDVYALGRVLDIYGMDIYTDVRRDYRPTDAMIYAISDRLGGDQGYHCLETQPTTCAVPEGGWTDQQRGFRKYGDDRRLIPWLAVPHFQTGRGHQCRSR
jgi:beta-galactosidase GanA